MLPREQEQAIEALLRHTGLAVKNRATKPRRITFPWADEAVAEDAAKQETCRWHVWRVTCEGPKDARAIVDDRVKEGYEYVGYEVHHVSRPYDWDANIWPRKGEFMTQLVLRFRGKHEIDYDTTHPKVNRKDCPPKPLGENQPCGCCQKRKV